MTVILGICGGSGAGKTQLIRLLAEQLGDLASVISVDWYYRDLGHLPPAQRGQTNFDDPDAIEFTLLEKHLSQLKAGRGVVSPRYDFATHTRVESEGYPVEPADFLLVEGVIVFTSERSRSAYSRTIYLDADDDLRLARRVLRDMAERGRTPRAVIDQYLATVKPMHAAHVEPQKHVADAVYLSNTPAHLEHAVASILASLLECCAVE